ncbi:MAG: desulfoferrodoxin [Pirellulales bacterium]|nr:desulfoferrodoxin [Pirellulales bacterium]
MASEALQVYECLICGSMVEVLRGGNGTFWCCKQPMKLLEENTTDAAKEKHVPVIEPVEGGVKVKVGSVPHPMQEDHFIEWIELLVDGKVCRQALKPGGPPEAFFPVQGEGLVAREYCNLHGLWKAG